MTNPITKGVNPMRCSIANSIRLLDSTWKPFTKSKTFHPFKYYILNFQKLSNSVEVLSEIYPPYATGWIHVELLLENHFKKILQNWEIRSKSTEPPTIADSIKLIKENRKFLKRMYDKLLTNNIRIKNAIKKKVMVNIENTDYLDNLVKINLSDESITQKEK